MPLRVVFMGTPDFAVPTLASLIGSGHEVAAVYCQPAKPSGRGMETRPSPVQTLASTSGLTIRTPTSLRGDEASRQFAAHDADVAVVVATEAAGGLHDVIDRQSGRTDAAEAVAKAAGKQPPAAH